MSVGTIALFFIYAWGFGFAFTSFVKNSENFLERNLMRIGFGLGVIPVLSVILNLLNIPLDWRFFLVLALLGPAFHAFKLHQKKQLKVPGIKIQKYDLFIVGAIVLSLLILYMYLLGSFSYPWLENGDPYEYATATYFIATEKTFSKEAPQVDRVLETKENYYYGLAHYAEPYPIGYSAVMGLIKQTSPNMIWTLKFFNSLILALAVLFFFFMVKDFTGNRKIALISTLVFAAVPSYLTHFIYSQSLAMTLIYPALYAINRMKLDWKWMFIAAIVSASVLITQMVAAMLFTVVFVGGYFIVQLVVNQKQAMKMIPYGILTGILAFIYWGWMLLKYGLVGIMAQNAIASGNPTKVGGNHGFFPFSTFYGFVDRIDGPFGLGLGVFVLLILSFAVFFLFWNQIISRKKLREHDWVLFGMFWLLAILVNIQSAPLPFGVVPHRSWAYWAISIGFMVGFAIYLVTRAVRKIHYASLAIILGVILLLGTTSFQDKWIENTVPWPQHWFPQDPNGDLGGYMWLADAPLAEDARITSVCRRDDFVITWDRHSDAQWDIEMIDFNRNFMEKTPDEIRSFYQSKNYQYFILDTRCAEEFGINATIHKLQELGNASYSIATQQFQNFWMFVV